MDYIKKGDIVEAFRGCGIQPGATMMLHADSIFLSLTEPMPVEERFALLFDALEEVLQPEGTLIVPTFSYSATKGLPFNPDDTPSDVGALTEYFRKLPDVVRSRDPIFSMAVRGSKADIFVNAKFEDSFGPESSFALLEKYNGWICCLACSLDRVTFTHFVEQSAKVDYRFLKEFDYTILQNEYSLNGALRFFVRHLDQDNEIDLSRLRERLLAKAHLKQQNLSRFALLAVQSQNFLEEALAMLASDPRALIK